MLIASFEALMKDDVKMQAFTSDPIRHATFLALYDYVKAGYKFSDLPWFSCWTNLRKLESEIVDCCVKKAA